MPKDTTTITVFGEDVGSLSSDQMREHFFDLIRKIDSSDEPASKDLQEYRTILKKFPELSEVVGDIAMHAREATLEYVAGNQQSVRISITQKMETLADSLHEDDSSPLETLLIENIVTCWLLFYETERRYIRMMGNSETTMRQGRYWEDRLSAAQNRFLKACRELARTRKMLAPMQVNIGVNQVNSVTK